MPWRLARSSTKKRVWVGWPPRLTWKASMTLAKPSRTVASVSCVLSRSPRLRDRQASRNRLWAGVLCRSSTCRCSQRAVLEVLQALAVAHDMGWEDIVSEAGRKRAERGGFDHRIFLEYVDQTP